MLRHGIACGTRKRNPDMLPPARTSGGRASPGDDGCRSDRTMSRRADHRSEFTDVASRLAAVDEEG